MHGGRLMRKMGLQGAVRGRRFKTTKPDSSGARPMDLVERDFNATRPEELWVSDLTYVATWRGFVYVAFVIDVFARFIVGWRATTSLTAGIALDALEQALHERRLNPEDTSVHHSDRGVQYVSIPLHPSGSPRRALSRPSAAEATPYDNALAESIIGLYKTEVSRRREPWRGLEDVEFATLEWVHWYKHATTLGADRKCRPHRVRDELLSVAGRLARDGETQLKQSPENPGRVQLERKVVRDSERQLRLCERGWKMAVKWECETKELDGLWGKIKGFLTGDSPMTQTPEPGSAGLAKAVTGTS